MDLIIGNWQRKMKIFFVFFLVIVPAKVLFSFQKPDDFFPTIILLQILAQIDVGRATPPHCHANATLTVPNSEIVATTLNRSALVRIADLF